MRKIIWAAPFALFLALAAPVAAQNFEAGREAYLRENYAAALQHWQPLAAAGH
ncbi:MAG: sel1 repeat family protein, partial [Rhodospirillaceae bacterium]|nr:sel1 repeat family protein [Rhodospirillaceae bacterium]